MSKVIDETGKRYGKLKVMHRSENTPLDQTRWSCICDCGKELVVNGTSLRQKKTISCGCSKIERWLLPKSVAAFNKLFYMYKYAAKRRGLEFNLSENEFRKITKQHCHYCGATPSAVFKTQSDLSGTYTYNGIDRKDSSIGYTLENCVPCCSLCNTAKMDLGYDDFILLISKIYNHMKIVSV
jgi:hypothetical protein